MVAHSHTQPSCCQAWGVCAQRTSATWHYGYTLTKSTGWGKWVSGRHIFGQPLLTWMWLGNCSAILLSGLRHNKGRQAQHFVHEDGERTLQIFIDTSITNCKNADQSETEEGPVLGPAGLYSSPSLGITSGGCQSSTAPSHWGDLVISHDRGAMCEAQAML